MILIFASIFGCSREEPEFIKNLQVQISLPAAFKPDVIYGNKRVVFTSSFTTYEFETLPDGSLVIQEIIPDVYTINTSWEITGQQYKEMLQVPVSIEDNARVLINTTINNLAVFTSNNIQLVLESHILRDLIISKVYYSGTKDNLNKNYVVDQFVEIFNNSENIVYVDGKYLALAESVSPAAYLASDNPDYIYTRQIVRFPGNGNDYPVLPGESIVISARDARNHLINATKSVDLSDADFEVKDSDGLGNPAIKSLPMYSSSTALKFFNLIAGGPNAIFLFETDEDVLEWPEFYRPGMSAGERFRRVPAVTVIDGVEALKNDAGTGPNISLKRLQNFIDAGYSYINATGGYINQSIERKVSHIVDGRIVLKDTNNSIQDFVVINGPTPRKYDHQELHN
jgi:hypothetical protein